MTLPPDRVESAGAADDDRTGTSTPILTPTANVELLHGTTTEIESWLRAVAAGQPWYPHADCPLCRAGLVRAA